jgi:hypothetical protein
MLLEFTRGDCMTRYLRVINDSELYRELKEMHVDQLKLIKYKSQIEELIMCDMDLNLLHSRRLALRKVPEALKHVFKNKSDENGFYSVKPRTELNKKWNSLLLESGIIFKSIQEIMIVYELFPCKDKPILESYIKLGDDFYFIAKDQLIENEYIHSDMEFISELEFLEVRRLFINDEAAS